MKKPNIIPPAGAVFPSLSDLGNWIRKQGLPFLSAKKQKELDVRFNKLYGQKQAGDYDQKVNEEAKALKDKSSAELVAYAASAKVRLDALEELLIESKKMHALSLVISDQTARAVNMLIRGKRPGLLELLPKEEIDMLTEFLK